MRLTVVRHAKSARMDTGKDGRKDGALPDHERPLNRRGRDDAPRMAAWLRGTGVQPDWAWVSTARRTRDTAAVLLDALALPGHLQLADARLYLADAGTLLDVLRETPVDREWAVLVGHNPGVTDLVNQLAGAHVHDDLPTLAVATFDLRCEAWVDLRPGTGTLRGLMSPRRLPDAA